MSLMRALSRAWVEALFLSGVLWSPARWCPLLGAFGSWVVVLGLGVPGACLWWCPLLRFCLLVVPPLPGALVPGGWCPVWVCRCFAPGVCLWLSPWSGWCLGGAGVLAWWCSYYVSQELCLHGSLASVLRGDGHLVASS